MHGIMNHVLLRQRGFSLDKPKSALSVNMFYNHTLRWLPRITERTCLNMKFNSHVF